MPGRRTPPMPARLGPQCARSALTSVPSGLPGAGMHHHAGRLVDDDQVRILEADVERDRLRRRHRRRSGSGSDDDDLGAAAARCAGSRSTRAARSR